MSTAAIATGALFLSAALLTPASLKLYPLLTIDRNAEVTRVRQSANMLGLVRLRFIPVMTALSALGALTPASAAPVSGTINFTVVAPLSITKTQDMNFGTLVPGATAGTVVLNASTGVVSPTGGVLTVSGVTSAAQFLLTSQSALYVVISYPAATTLTNAGGTTMAVNNITWTNIAALCLGNTCLPLGNSITAKFGGTLNVAANQSPGVYAGTYIVTANFQ